MFRSLLLSLLLAAAAHGRDGSKDSSSTQHVDIHSKSLILAKIWCLILVLAGTFIGGVSPYLLKSNDVFLLLGTHFAVGLFLATSMVRFPLDAIETFGDLMEKESSFSFMLPLVGCLLASVAGFAISYVYGKKEEEQSGRSNGDLEFSGTIVQGKGSNANGTTHYHNASVDVRSPSDSILLIIALSFHSVFEGIAIGAAETEADAWRALWTISPHSMLAAIGMGTILLRMMPSRPLLSCVGYAFAFAISSPIGMVIGIIVDPTPQCEVAGWIFAISMGLARGMFIYVSVSQMLSKRYVPQSAVSVDTPIHKFSAMMLGCGVVAALMIWDAFGCSPAVFLLERKREANITVKVPDT